MPSAFTHAVVGAAISTLAPRRFRGAKLAIVLAVAAAAPDADVLAFGFGIPYAHLLGHRGLTHSLPFAFLVAVMLWSWLARGSLRSRAGGELFLIILLACASHGVLDAFTDAGLGVGFFVPFSDARFFFPWRPILTSPLSGREFFSAKGVAILRNEVEWIWLPIGLMVGATALTRRLAQRGVANQRLR
jgi:inner membrane protein